MSKTLMAQKKGGNNMLKEMNNQELMAVEGGSTFLGFTLDLLGAIEDIFFSGLRIGQWIGAEAWKNENR